MAKKPVRAYQRVLLKLSGEALTADGEFGLNGRVLKKLGGMIANVAKSGVQIAVVVGGGNIWRYTEGHEAEVERVTSDTMGMLATVINGIALQNAIEQAGGECRVQTAIHMAQVAEPYIRRRAVRHLEKGRVVIFAAGTGNPYFTTDSAAALRALEIGADALLKGTKVDGIYDRDPHRHAKAKRYQRISYKEVMTKELDVMDSTAVTLCKDNRLPIIVFNILKDGTLLDLLDGKPVGTKVAL